MRYHVKFVCVCMFVCVFALKLVYQHVYQVPTVLPFYFWCLCFCVRV